MPDANAPAEPSQQFLEFIQTQAAAMRTDEPRPGSLDDWNTLRRILRKNLEKAWGPFPKSPCALEPQLLGEIKRETYHVEKVVFQTRPGVLMTANAYVPDGDGRRPAVLCVHGHWRGAKQDPVVQARCIGLVKLGFFVLVVDAFGAGERALGKALGEYHGEMVAATLYPTGLALSGLQVYENMRAVDYLQSRPEVDPDRIGITGASGGGNQTMYAAAYDERFGCAVPTCSVGRYQSYLGAACCMCEVVPGVLTFTEEWGLLALVAPRALMVINATADAFQFSVGEAKQSLAVAQTVFDLYAKSDHLKHAVFESKHDYNQAMREAMYGWMTLHLKGEGDGEPLAEPPIETEDPETLRCYPGNSRPDDFVTIPQFAAAEGRRILSVRKPPEHLEHWQTDAQWLTESLQRRLLGRFPKRLPLEMRVTETDSPQARLLEFEPEPGITVTARYEVGASEPRRLAVILDAAGGEAAADGELAKEFRARGWDLAALDLRATGRTAYPGDGINRAPDHNTAEWSLLIGRPLVGQWVWDITRLLDALEQAKIERPEQTALVGVGPAGIAALLTAALDPRFTQVAAVGTLATYISETPYEGQRLAVIVPGILPRAGDVPHLAALVAPRRLVLSGSVTGDGTPLTQQELESQFQYTSQAYSLQEAPSQLKLAAEASAETIADLLKTP